MSVFQNSIPKFIEAADAATRMMKLRRDLLILEQELKTVRQVKRGVWLGASLLLFNLLLFLTLFWLGMGLHENGWSAYALAGLTFLVLGLLVFLSLLTAYRVGKAPLEKSPHETYPTYQ